MYMYTCTCTCTRTCRNYMYVGSYSSTCTCTCTYTMQYMQLHVLTLEWMCSRPSTASLNSLHTRSGLEYSSPESISCRNVWFSQYSICSGHNTLAWSIQPQYMYIPHTLPYSGKFSRRKIFLHFLRIDLQPRKFSAQKFSDTYAL